MSRLLHRPISRKRCSAAAGVLAIVGILLLPAAALAAHEYEGSFGPDGTEGTTFTDIGDGAPVLAVDQQSGAIYVLNPATSTIYKFNESHQPAPFSGLSSNEITGVPTRISGGRSQLAVDAASHRIYATSGVGTSRNSIFAFEANGEPAEFSALGGAHEITGFSDLCGVAIDQNGDVYAAERAANKVSVFAASGAEITHFTAPESCNLAVDSAGAVYVNKLLETALFVPSTVEKFTPSIFPVTTGTVYSAAGTPADPGPSYSVAVSPTTNHLYADRGSKIVEHGTGGVEVPPPFGESGEGALSGSTSTAVKGSGPSERIYASSHAPQGGYRVEIFGPIVNPPEAVTGAAGEVGKTTAVLSGTVNPKGLALSECKFEYGLSTTYVQSVPCDSAVPVDSESHSVTAHLSGLTPNTKYHYRLVAANLSAGAKGADATFETLGPPRISEESASEVSATGAKIFGLIDPRAEATAFAVEYVTQADFSQTEYADAITVPEPFAEIGSGLGNVGVSQVLSGLTPGTTYHYRLVATNWVDPPVEGSDETFTTFLQATGLPDSRAYEMVSPPVKSGEVIPPEPQGGLGGACGECLPGSNVLKMPMQPSPGGEEVTYEGQAFGGGTASEANEYLATRGSAGWANEGLSQPQYRANSALEEQGQGFLSFSRDLSRGVIGQVEPSLSPEAPADYANLYLWHRGGAPLQPLITKAPPHRLAGTIGGLGGNRFLVVYAGANDGEGASPSFSHIAFEANDALTDAVPGIAPAAPEVPAINRNLYEWAGGELRLVNVLPGNAAAAPDAVIGSGRLLSPRPSTEGPDFDRAISADGSRIFWTDKASDQVYVREGGTTTVQIPDSGGFLTASTDGSRVLLSDGHVYNLETEATTDLTAGLSGFQGALGASRDLSRIYFVDTAVLAGENGEHRSPANGEDNLYVWQGGVTSFIATLSPTDDIFGSKEAIGAWRPSPSFQTAQVSPDGEYLAFMSTASLTGYDNRQRSSENCRSVANGSTTVCSEVFEFDSASAKLTCVSCNPTGERPLGYSNLSLIDFGSRATFLPQPNNLTAEGQGRLFFESQDTLSNHDNNGHIQDVYEWEQDGVGSCPQVEGCVSLISSGHSGNDSQFLNATPSGDDVFIVTRERLLPRRDKDDYLDLYDARVGGGIPESVEAPCEGEACKEPLASQPAEHAPTSSSFVGPGNSSPPCRAGFVKRGAKCVKKHRHGKKKHGRSAEHRHGGSK